MPAESRKPSPGRFISSPEPQVTQAQFNAGKKQLEGMPGEAWSDVNRFNSQMLALTQPYARAGELREGQAFVRQQEAAIRAENVGAAPPRTLDRSGFGLARPLRDVGP